MRSVIVGLVLALVAPAAEVGTFSIGVPTPDKGVQQASGKYIVLWQRGEAGKWRLRRDMWNDDPAGK